MKPRYQVSKAALELIKSFEGFRNTAAKLPDGRWVIGYGHTLSTREGIEVSESDAEALLIYDLMAVADSVNELTFTPLSQNQFDALCAFVYNIGIEAFKGSEVLQYINEGRLLQAACAMELWRRAEFQGNSLIIDAIVRRRAAEKTLFLKPTKGWVPAPSAILRPTLDIDTLGQVPRVSPTDLMASLDGRETKVERLDRPEPKAPIQPAPPALEPEPPLFLSASGQTPSPPSNPAPSSSAPLRAEPAPTVFQSEAFPQTDQTPDPAPTSHPRDTFGLRQEPLPEPSAASGWTIVDQPKVNLERVLTIGLPALALALAGFYWSGHGAIGSGALHPFFVGWLLGAIGLFGVCYAAYLLLVDLGYIEPIEDSLAERD